MKDLLHIKSKIKFNQEIEKMHPHDVVLYVESLKEEQQDDFYARLTSENLADVVAYLEPDVAANVINKLNIEVQKSVIENLEVDDAADIMVYLRNQEKILEDVFQKEKIQKILTYEEDQTGSFMTTSYIGFQESFSKKEATKIVIKEAGEVDSITNLFVYNKDNKYVGAIELKKLIKANDEIEIIDIMDSYPFVFDTDLIQKSVHKIKEYGLYEVPVLNNQHELVGLLTLDDALDVYHEETILDYEMLSALPDTTTKGFLASAVKRLPWLLLLLILSIPIAFLTTRFEEVIATVTILAIFQPLILDAGGDVATQTLAVTLRILTKDKKGALKNGAKEIIAGMINGLLLGISAAIIAYLLALSIKTNAPFNISIVVGLSLTLTIFSGPFFGLLIPIFLDKIKIDPAVASGPFITTLIDIASVFIYFGLASLIMGVF